MMSARNLGIKRRGGRRFKKSNGGRGGAEPGPDGLDGQDSGRARDSASQARHGWERKEQWQW